MPDDMFSALCRLEDEARLSDEQIIEDARFHGEIPSVLAAVTKGVMLEALETNLNDRFELTAHQRFRPLLLLTMSRLALIGIGCSPATGAKLVRDFFASKPAQRDWMAKDVIEGFLSFAHEASVLEVARMG